MKRLHMDTASLYQQLLGDKFRLMLPNLQRFHSAKNPVKAVGRFEVIHGTHPFCRLLAKLADLPLETNSGEAELIVAPAPAAEIWSRRIDSKKVISKQCLKNGLLVERFKILHILLQAEVEDGILFINDVSASVLGVRFPKFFTPKVSATGADNANGVEVNVDILFKPFGRIINYRGIVRIEEM